MLIRVRTLRHYKIHALDGEIGQLDQLYFDDETWTVSYVVVNLGSWLSGRQVLISPTAILEVDPLHKMLNLTLTKDQIEKSDDISTQNGCSPASDRLLNLFWMAFKSRTVRSKPNSSPFYQRQRSEGFWTRAICDFTVGRRERFSFAKHRCGGCISHHGAG